MYYLIDKYKSRGLSSIRVSNELGANRPKETKIAVLVAVSTSIVMGAIFMGVVLIWRTSLPKLFSDSEEVIHGASKLGHLLSLTVCMSSIWPVLSGKVVLLHLHDDRVPNEFELVFGLN